MRLLNNNEATLSRWLLARNTTILVTPHLISHYGRNTYMNTSLICKFTGNNVLSDNSNNVSWGISRLLEGAIRGEANILVLLWE